MGIYGGFMRGGLCRYIWGLMDAGGCEGVRGVL